MESTVKVISPESITDEMDLVDVRYGKWSNFELNMRHYDDGFGLLWVYVESMGPLGVVRATSFEDAWEIIEDEIMDRANLDDLDAETKAMLQLGESTEGYVWSSNGGLASYDLSGSALLPLSNERAEGYGIQVHVSEGTVQKG